LTAYRAVFPECNNGCHPFSNYADNARYSKTTENLLRVIHGLIIRQLKTLSSRAYFHRCNIVATADSQSAPVTVQ
jgi:hypothetical protein